ncbi:MAG: S-layer homology domain-containing protein [Ruminococcaceae bacterium]|nr:S-layer homology domain-containing protein [Oscillospiraceae bacterium]
MKKLITIILAAVLVIGCSATEIVLPAETTAAQVVSTAVDPVISQSYLEGTLIPDVESKLESYVDAGLGSVYMDGFYKAGQLAAQYNLRRAMNNDGYRETSGSVRLKKGDAVTLALGSSFVVEAGTGFAVGSLSNVTAGTLVGDGDYLPANQSCMSSSENTGFTVESETMQVVFSGPYSLVVSSEPDYNSTANALNTMGLFKGDSSGYALERAATRTEALVMFIRLLGQEDEALAFDGTHPFTDVDTWANSYVAYAYSKGYTKGISDTLFGATNPVAAADYMTFLMRALGYAENVDFAWKTAVDDAVELGIINSTESGIITSNFLRCHVAYISYYALYASVAGSETTLLQKLMDDGSVSNVVPAAAKIVGARIGNLQ